MLQKQGFTLIEVMLSIVLTGILILPFFLLWQGAISVNMFSQEVSEVRREGWRLRSRLENDILHAEEVDIDDDEMILEFSGTDEIEYDRENDSIRRIEDTTSGDEITTFAENMVEDVEYEENGGNVRVNIRLISREENKIFEIDDEFRMRNQ